MKNKRRSLCTLASMLLFLAISQGLSAQEDARQIVEKSLDRPSPQSEVGNSELVLLNKNGSKRSRSISQYSRQTSEGTDSFIEFLSPADVRGTRFLTIGHGKNPKLEDEQRLYLPALGSIKRIASSEKGGSFMGTELFYFDLEERSIDDYSQFQLLGSETLRNTDCYKVSVSISAQDAPYSKQTLWIGKEDHVVYQVEAYDKKGSLLKRIIFLDVKSYGAKGYKIPSKIYVENVQNGNKTLMSRGDIKVDQSLDNSIFSVQNLNR